MKTYHSIYTIGHSTLPESIFLEFLQRRSVEILIDVRSSPYSRRAPQFNRSTMANWLAASGMKYLFAGKALGGRPSDPAMYVAGAVSYERMAASDSFLLALRSLVRMTRQWTAALMCAESDPLECHRFLLISRVLGEKGFEVAHILRGGSVEPQPEAERRLLAVTGLAQAELFGSRDDVLPKAYAIQADRFGFRPDAPRTVPEARYR
jgi:uncharacterized protein (DUF488 family)